MVLIAIAETLSLIQIPDDCISCYSYIKVCLCLLQLQIIVCFFLCIYVCILRYIFIIVFQHSWLFFNNQIHNSPVQVCRTPPLPTLPQYYSTHWWKEENHGSRTAPIIPSFLQNDVPHLCSCACMCMCVSVCVCGNPL